MIEQTTPLLRIDGKPFIPPGGHDPRFDYKSGTRDCDKGNRQQPSEHGRALGAAVARIADEQVASNPDIPDRCKTCAFRAGTIPNQMAGTLVEAMHCVAGTDPNPFGCHQSLDGEGLPTHLCAGYVLARRAPFERIREGLEEVLTTLQAARVHGTENPPHAG